MSLQEAAEEVGGDSSCHYRDANYQFVGFAEQFTFIADERSNHQRQRRQSDGDRADDAAGNAVRPLEIGLPNPQRDERPKFEKNAQAGEQHVENQASLKAEWVANRPKNSA